jgi:hypothetical protein
LKRIPAPPAATHDSCDTHLFIQIVYQFESSIPLSC